MSRPRLSTELCSDIRGFLGLPETATVGENILRMLLNHAKESSRLLEASLSQPTLAPLSTPPVAAVTDQPATLTPMEEPNYDADTTSTRLALSDFDDD